jgi:hypothetical protein
MAEIRVEDVTTDVLKELNDFVPNGQPPSQALRTLLLPNNFGCFREPIVGENLGCRPLWPLTTWDRPELSEYNYVEDPPVDNQTGNLRVTSRTIYPRTFEFVFKIEGIEVPKLVAVSWPTALLTRKNSPVPFLVYFRPEFIPGPDNRQSGQRGFGPFYTSPPLKRYPWGWDFLFYGFWNYLNYRADPLTYKDERWRCGQSRACRSKAEAAQLGFGLTETDEKFSFGLPYQIAASGKPVVLVFPLGGARTFGDFHKAEVVQRTLESIQSFVLKQAHIQPAPALEWVALAGFSKSNATVANFLQGTVNKENRDHPFVRRIVREVYIFDPPLDTGEASIRGIIGWAQRTAEFNAYGVAVKAIRAYSQHPFSALTDLLGESLPHGAFFRESRLGVQISNTNLFQTLPWSAAVIPLSAWKEAQATARASDRLRTSAQIDEDLAAANRATSPSGRLARIGMSFRRKWALQEQGEYDKHNRIGVNRDDAHLALAGMLLTDAVRRNGFNYATFTPRLRRGADDARSMAGSQSNVARPVVW